MALFGGGAEGARAIGHQVAGVGICAVFEQPADEINLLTVLIRRRITIPALIEERRTPLRTLSSQTILISKSPACSKSSLMSIKPAVMRTLQISGNSPFWASLISSSLGFAPSSNNRRRVSASPVLMARLSGLFSSWVIEVDILIAVRGTCVL